MADYQGPYTGAQVDAALKVAMETPAKLEELKTYVDQNLGGGGSINPELLEACMPMSRDFSDDFNNDFAR